MVHFSTVIDQPGWLTFILQKTLDLLYVILSHLIFYLLETEREVQEEAARLINYILDDFHLRPVKGLHASKIKLELEYNIIDSLLDDINPQIRYCGINLLTFYPFTGNNNDESFLTKILICQNKQEAKLWARFIRFVKLVDEIKYEAIWKNVLERILSKGHKVYSVIRIAALDRYRTVVDSEENSSNFNEHDLGLPLIHDNL